MLAIAKCNTFKLLTTHQSTFSLPSYNLKFSMLDKLQVTRINKSNCLRIYKLDIQVPASNQKIIAFGSTWKPLCQNGTA